MGSHNSQNMHPLLGYFWSGEEEPEEFWSSICYSTLFVGESFSYFEKVISGNTYPFRPSQRMRSPHAKNTPQLRIYNQPAEEPKEAIAHPRRMLPLYVDCTYRLYFYNPPLLGYFNSRPSGNRSRCIGSYICAAAPRQKKSSYKKSFETFSSWAGSVVCAYAHLSLSGVVIPEIQPPSWGRLCSSFSSEFPFFHSCLCLLKSF
jgi:hypothetical protein